MAFFPLFFVPAPSLFSRGLLLRCTAGGEGTAEKKMVAAAVGFGGDDEVGLGKLLDRGMEKMMRVLAVLAEKAASGARKQQPREGDGQGRDWFWVFSLSRLKTELSAFPPKRTPLPLGQLLIAVFIGEGGAGLLLRVGSRGAACWSARQGGWGFRFGHCSMF